MFKYGLHGFFNTSSWSLQSRAANNQIKTVYNHITGKYDTLQRSNLFWTKYSFIHWVQSSIQGDSNLNFVPEFELLQY